MSYQAAHSVAQRAADNADRRFRNARRNPNTRGSQLRALERERADAEEFADIARGERDYERRCGNG